jgi:hypothetical protein
MAAKVMKKEASGMKRSTRGYESLRELQKRAKSYGSGAVFLFLEHGVKGY